MFFHCEYGKLLWLDGDEGVVCMVPGEPVELVPDYFSMIVTVFLCPEHGKRVKPDET